jgi:hypothetical protein
LRQPAHTLQRDWNLLWNAYAGDGAGRGTGNGYRGDIGENGAVGELC